MMFLCMRTPSKLKELGGRTLVQLCRLQELTQQIIQKSSLTQEGHKQAASYCLTRIPSEIEKAVDTADAICILYLNAVLFC